MVRMNGLEPSTSRLSVVRSYQLNYTRIYKANFFSYTIALPIKLFPHTLREEGLEPSTNSPHDKKNKLLSSPLFYLFIFLLINKLAVISPLTFIVV